jgi:HK97 family phage portal protein
MGLLTALFQRRSIENPSTPLSSPDDWLYGALGAGKSSSGVNVNRETALTYSPFWRGVNLISKDVGKLPCKTERREGRAWVEATEHSAYGLLRHKANDAMTAMVFRTTLQGHALCEGNGYAYIWRNGAGEPDYEAGGLTILNPRQVTPIRYNGTLWYIYQFQTGETRRLPYTDVIHIKGFSFDGLIGYNLVHKARECLGLAMGREVYASVFFRNAAIPKVVIQVPKGHKMSPEAVTNLRTSWERMHSGLEQSHRTAVLEEGAEAKILSVCRRTKSAARDARPTRASKWRTRPTLMKGSTPGW